MKLGFKITYTPINPIITADHLLIPTSSFKKILANIVIKKGVTKNNAVAVAKGKTVTETQGKKRFRPTGTGSHARAVQTKRGLRRGEAIQRFREAGKKRKR